MLKKEKNQIRKNIKTEKTQNPIKKSSPSARETSLVCKFKGKKKTRSQILHRKIFGHLKIIFLITCIDLSVRTITTISNL